MSEQRMLLLLLWQQANCYTSYFTASTKRNCCTDYRADPSNAPNWRTVLSSNHSAGKSLPICSSVGRNWGCWSAYCRPWRAGSWFHVISKIGFWSRPDRSIHLCGQQEHLPVSSNGYWLAWAEYLWHSFSNLPVKEENLICRTSTISNWIIMLFSRSLSWMSC